MAGVTIPYGFELPIGGEKISRELIIRNFQKTNDLLKTGLAVITSANSTSNNASYDGRQCHYTRVKIGTSGIIIIEVRIISKIAFAMNDVVAGNTAVMAPAGYNIRTSTLFQVGTIGGAGANSSAQFSVEEAGNITIRRNGTINATFPIGATLGGIVVAEWNGVG